MGFHKHFVLFVSKRQTDSGIGNQKQFGFVFLSGFLFLSLSRAKQLGDAGSSGVSGLHTRALATSLWANNG